MNQIIGVLWKKEKDGREYFSGILNDLRGKINIAVFPNKFKEADNQPDMNIVISWYNPEEQKDKDSEDGSKQSKAKKTYHKKKTIDENQDEVPF